MSRIESGRAEITRVAGNVECGAAPLGRAGPMTAQARNTRVTYTDMELALAAQTHALVLLVTRGCSSDEAGRGHCPQTRQFCE